MRIVVIDTETGGLDPARHSILSVGVALLENGKVLDAREWLVAEPEEELAYDQEALRINGINIEAHMKVAEPPRDVLVGIADFIPRNFRQNRGRAQLAGHNIGFDVGFMRRLARLGGLPDYMRDMFAYKHLDTSVILQYLAARGELEYNPGSLGKACEFFGITLDNAHTAKADAVATAELLARMLAPPSELLNPSASEREADQLGLF